MGESPGSNAVRLLDNPPHLLLPRSDTQGESGVVSRSAVLFRFPLSQERGRGISRLPLLVAHCVY